MATRRPHTKSRLGCAQCKARKVKCDQAAPVCSHCARRKQECSLTEVYLHLAKTNSSSASSTRPISKTPSLPAAPSQPFISSFAAKGYTALDLELVYWYATETWRHLQHRMEAAVLWKGPLFDLALANPSFMDAILTTAAMHRLATQPNTCKKEAYAQVIMHKGIRIIPAIVENLNAPSQDNCVMLLASTILLTIWAFGSIHLPPQANLFTTPEFAAQAPSPVEMSTTSSPRLDQFLTVATFAGGTYAVVMAMRTEIYNSGFSEMIAATPWETLAPPPQNVVYGLNALEAHARSLTDDLGAEITDEYVIQIQRLHQMFQASQARVWSDTVVGFAVRLTKIMTTQLAKRQPLALTILAYWTAALKTVDDTWWVKDWPKAVFQEITEVLDADWRAHLRVPAKYFE